MAKMVIRDDCNAPERNISIKYSGPNPWGIASFIDGSVKSFFHVKTVLLSLSQILSRQFKILIQSGIHT